MSGGGPNSSFQAQNLANQNAPGGGGQSESRNKTDHRRQPERDVTFTLGAPVFSFYAGQFKERAAESHLADLFTPQVIRLGLLGEPFERKEPPAKVGLSPAWERPKR